MKYTHQVSNDENRVLELLRGVERGKLFNGTDGPSR